MSANDAQILATIESLALAAGETVMRVHAKGCAVHTKADDSPVTQADREAEAIILKGLRASFPVIPIVAEEESAAGVCPTDPGREFFLVDPLDGTREFISGRGDFTVNIALIRDGVPVLGVVFAPVSRVLYSGGEGRAERIAVDDNFQLQERRRISVRLRVTPLTIVASRSHRNAETDKLITSHPQAEIVSVGSSLKFCLVASGEADYYPRCGPTMQWDTAAGDAVLRAAGGMTSTLDGKPLLYGAIAAQKPYLNPNFVAEGKS